MASLPAARQHRRCTDMPLTSICLCHRCPKPKDVHCFDYDAKRDYVKVMRHCVTPHPAVMLQVQAGGAGLHIGHCPLDEFGWSSRFAADRSSRLCSGKLDDEQHSFLCAVQVTLKEKCYKKYDHIAVSYYDYHEGHTAVDYKWAMHDYGTAHFVCLLWHLT